MCRFRFAADIDFANMLEVQKPLSLYNGCSVNQKPDPAQIQADPDPSHA